MMNRTQARPIARLRLPTAALLAALILAGCASLSANPVENKPPPREAHAARAPAVVQPPVSGLVAALEDDIQELPGGRIAWRTHWLLCWDPYPQALAYELRAITAEGAPGQLRRQSERCLRIEAAAGENEKSQGLAHRDLLLAIASGQLAYRVRAVLEGSRVSEWSHPMAVGKEARALRD